MEKKVYAKLLEVQQKLRVPKGRMNKFGGYSFRNASDILEAAKPHLEAVKAAILLEDEIRECGTRFYLRATATFVDVETGDTVSTVGMAREEDAKKGMDSAQLTGACSSYARKYALCGLLAIDDSRLDPDEVGGEPARTVAAPAQATNALRPTEPAPKPTPAKKMSHQPNPRAVKAWTAFLALPGMDRKTKEARTDEWKSLLLVSAGTDATAKLTDADWDKVDAQIADLVQSTAAVAKEIEGGAK